MNSLNFFLLQSTDTNMLHMEYPYIRGEDFPDYAENATWNNFHAYIDAHSQRLIDEYTGYGVQDISIIKYQFAKKPFDEQIRYNILF